MNCAHPRAVATLRAGGIFVLLFVMASACASSPGHRAQPFAGARPPLPIAEHRLMVGVGDRLFGHPNESGMDWLATAREHSLPSDLHGIWLPRSWQADWLDTATLQRMSDSGTTPVVLHYFFDEGISKERIIAQREAWHRSLRRMAAAVRIDGSVLIVMAPEFNDDPPPGETRLTDWAGFADELVAAVEILRAGAPNASIGLCAGDFSPDRNLSRVIDPVAGLLYLLVFPVRRASPRLEGRLSDYLGVGGAALEYTRYLHDSFGLPVFLAYVAVSSYGGWEQNQSRAIEDLVTHRAALHGAGAFGVIYFQMRDDPEHTGYFGEAEKYFGLLAADGEAKPAVRAFGKLGEEF